MASFKLVLKKPRAKKGLIKEMEFDNINSAYIYVVSTYGLPEDSHILSLATLYRKTYTSNEEITFYWSFAVQATIKKAS
jgi:hypothetical protein